MIHMATICLNLLRFALPVHCIDKSQSFDIGLEKMLASWVDDFVNGWLIIYFELTLDPLYNDNIVNCCWWCTYNSI